MNRKPILILVGIGFFGCGCGPDHESSLWFGDRPRQRLDRTVVVATDAAFPPFHRRIDWICGTPMAKSKTKKPRSVGPEDFLGGGVTGHDIELARELLLRAGYRIGIEVSPYAELMPGLDEDRWDLVAATTGITPERAAKYLFSEPYFETCQAVLVRAGTGEPLALEDLRGRRVGAAGDGTSARAVQGLTDRFGVAGVRLGKGQAGVPALLDGEIDALVVDEFEAVTAAREDADRLHVMSEPAALEHYGFVMRKGDLGLKEVVDHGLLEMRRDGSLAKLRAFYKVERDEDWPIVGMRPEVD